MWIVFANNNKPSPKTNEEKTEVRFMWLPRIFNLGGVWSFIWLEKVQITKIYKGEIEVYFSIWEKHIWHITSVVRL